MLIFLSYLLSAGVNHWTGPNSNDMNMAAGGGKPNGWDEPSPPAQRRNMPNMPGYDDGTALWGNQGSFLSQRK